ncbi:MAG: HD domain-containing protein [Armatimonadetes bacterium]|nr:HD domain-containing protein [Armatimonadota bacterium]
MDRLAAQLSFITEIDRLKGVLRQNRVLRGERRENSAEHGWQLAVMAIVLAEHANEPIDVARVVRMTLLHDLVEIDAGDTFVYDTVAREAQAAVEAAAAERIFGLLPADQAAEFRALWDEFESFATPESRFAKALDRLAPVMLNCASEGVAWRSHGVGADRVLGLNARIAEGSQALWDAARAMIEEAVRQGHLSS